MMNVLFATHDYPFPITYGGQVYSGNMIKELAGLTDRLTVVAFDKDIRAREQRNAHGAHWTLVPMPHDSKLAALLSPLPRLAFRHKSEAYWDEIAGILERERPDYLIIDYIAIGWIAERATRLIADKRLPTRTLYMSHNVETLLRQQIAANYRGNPLMRLLARNDSRRATRLEERLCRTDVISVETSEDAAAFERLYAPERILLAPPGYAGEIVEQRTITGEVPRNVTVLGGRLSTMKQIVLDELLADASKAIVDQGVAFHVIGPMTEAYQTSVTARHPEATVHGFVENVLPLLAQMRAGIVADHVGGGFKHRILTYVFYRVPMIALPEAMVGLPLTPGEDYYPIASYRDVPAAVAELIDDVERLDRYQNRAFDRCRSEFSWSDLVTRFAAELRGLAAAR